MSSTTLERLNEEGTWLTRAQAAQYLDRTEGMVRKLVKDGIVREFCGARLWVAREDIATALKCRYSKIRPLPLAARYDLDEQLEFDGRALFRWAQQENYLPLVLELPEELTPPVPKYAENPEIMARLAKAEAMLADLYGAKIAVRRINPMDDETVEAFYGQVARALDAPYLPMAEVDEWLGVLENLEDSHFARFVRWAKDDPSRAQEICGAGVTSLAPIWKLAACLRSYAIASDDGTSGAVARRARADAAHLHVENRCQTRILVERTLLAESSRWLAVGLCPMDRRMIRRIWTMSTHSTKPSA